MAGRVNAADQGAPLLAERAYLGLRDMIVTLRLPPGAPIHEDRLSAELEVGRTPLRDAVKRLEAETLVVIYPRRGTFVTEVNITDHGLIADVRRQLEGHAAARAAELATEEQRRAMRALVTSLRKQRGDKQRSMQQDADVHRWVYESAHNRYLEATLSHYFNLSLRIWYLFLDRLPEADHTGEHVRMLQAIIEGDAEQARKLAIAHVDQFEQSVRDVL
ncbi:GntR family transcriptional regulator [Sciscionella sediminilitoris]|uniref:GntR family transcriptional regulator n=1 Tax=Sciscionella sediminilitoris TaxID=1445613 RepID=UPI0004DFAD14|nr:GntR family transcriptional regulator [Sciscionella sp. SE31]